MYSKILVALSLEHGIGPKALDVARGLKSEGGEITALHVYEPLSDSVRAYVTKDAVTNALNEVKRKLAERVGSDSDIKSVLLEGHSGRAITDYASEIGADCIVIGSHKPGFADHLLGSTAARIVRHAPCTVHVLR